MLNRMSMRRRRSMDVRSSRDRSTVRFGPECVRLSEVSKPDRWSRHGYPGGWRQRCFEARVERVPSGHGGHLRNGYRRSLPAAFVVNGVSITLVFGWRASSVRSEPDAGAKHGMCKAGWPTGMSNPSQRCMHFRRDGTDRHGLWATCFRRHPKGLSVERFRTREVTQPQPSGWA